MDKIEYQEILDKLVLGNPLNDVEAKLVDDNPKILDDLKELKLMKAGVTKAHLEDKLKMLSNFEKTEYKKPIKRKRALPAILFSTFLSLLIIGYLLFKALGPSVDVSKYFTPYPLANVDGEKNGAKDAYKYYNDAIYKEAVPLFDSHLKEVSNNKDLFYYGVSLLGSGDQKKAIQILNNPELIADKTYPTNYYLGLAYIDIDNDLARVHLEKTTEYTPEIQQKAKQLLTVLK